LVLELNDDGRGFQVEQTDGHGHGLTSMHERARRVGGSLEVDSGPDQGTRLKLIIPLGRSAVVRRLAAFKR